MNMKSDVNARHEPDEAIESVGDATIISWSLFASLDELGSAPAAPEPAAPAAPTVEGAPAEAAHAAGPGKGENLQSALDQYTEWLRTFNRR